MTSVLEKIRELEAQKDAIIDEAKQEAIDQAEHAVQVLNELGFEYRFILHVEGLNKKKTAKRRKTNLEVACKICDFRTEPGHDARRHRSQGEGKAPFSDAELADKGLVRVEEVEDRQVAEISLVDADPEVAGVFGD